MGSNATSLAVLDSNGMVVTFVRLDAPTGWRPPDGYTVVPDDELPEGWQMSPESRPPVPSTITARQARLWLVQHGISLSHVDDAIASISDDVTREVVMVEWEYGAEVHRKSQWLAALGPGLGLDDERLDQAFREAATL